MCQLFLNKTEEKEAKQNKKPSLKAYDPEQILYFLILPLLLLTPLPRTPLVTSSSHSKPKSSITLSIRHSASESSSKPDVWSHFPAPPPTAEKLG